MLTGADSNTRGEYHGNVPQVASAINLHKPLLGKSCHAYMNRTSEQAAIVNRQG